jgi:hypothetical protein
LLLASPFFSSLPALPAPVASVASAASVTVAPARPAHVRVAVAAASFFVASFLVAAFFVVACCVAAAILSFWAASHLPAPALLAQVLVAPASAFSIAFGLVAHIFLLGVWPSSPATVMVTRATAVYLLLAVSLLVVWGGDAAVQEQTEGRLRAKAGRRGARSPLSTTVAASSTSARSRGAPGG